MISNISGRVQEILEDGVILELGGIGVQVYVSSLMHGRLNISDTVFLHTQLIIREDSWTLYGFDTKEARTIFNLLITVSGIGPKLALAVLSHHTSQSIRDAIALGQPLIFSQVPGIGLKTAQKIVIHLQDKVPDSALAPGFGFYSEKNTDVISALTNLGYSIIEAQTALQSLPPDAPDDLESRIRIALQYFAG